MGLDIHIVSDVVCPWCYVGKRRLERALQTLDGRYEYRVTWRPFELNPGMPPEGMDRRQYLEGKFGSAPAVRQLEARVAAAGSEEGLDFAFDKIRRTPNTFDAHRLIWLAQREGLQDAVVEGLFRGYFIEGADLSRRETLIEIAGKAGLPARPSRAITPRRGRRGGGAGRRGRGQEGRHQRRPALHH